MSWSQIIGQQRIKSVLQRVITDGRIAHAYMFWGPQGIGKDALALEFAKAVNCLNPIKTDGNYIACDMCDSCRRAKSLQHPNIKFITALPAGKGEDRKSRSPLAKLSDEQLKQVQDELAQKAANPYHRIAIPNANAIRIAAIREIKQGVALSGTGKGRRFYIVSNAENMNQEAANAFLKTLEEPSPDVTIVLTTARRDQMLQTIRSRCQDVRCAVLSDDEIANALRENTTETISDENARLIARLANGSFTRALSLTGDDFSEIRGEVVDFFRAMLKRRNYVLDLYAQIEHIAADKDRKRVEQMLTLLLLWLRDAFALSASGNTDAVVNIDQVAPMQRFVENFPGADLLAASMKVEEALRYLKQNVQIHLTLTRLALEMRSIFIRKVTRAA